MDPIHRSPEISLTGFLAALSLNLIFVAACSAGMSSSGGQGGLDHRSQPDVSAGDGPGRVVWRYRTGGPIRSTADVADGRVYLGSTDGSLYALSQSDGEPIWIRDLGAAPGSPTVSDGRLLVWDRGQRLHALATEDGEPLWTVQAGPDRPLPWGAEGWDYLLPAPAVVAGRVYAARGDGIVRALDARDGSPIWRFDTGARLRTTPTVADGVLYVGNSAGILYALDQENGEELWRFETAGAGIDSEEAGFDRTQIFGAVAVDTDRVYLGSRDARLYALDRADGEEIWRVEEESAWVMSPPTVVDGVVYSARSSSGNARAVDARTGEELWMVNLDGPVWTAPVMVGERLYITVGASQYQGAAGGRLVALDPSDGSQVWSLAVDGAVWNTAVFADGRFYFGADDGHFYAVSADDDPSGPDHAVSHSVFWDPDLVARSYRYADPASGERLRDDLVDRGYRLVDADALAELFRAGRARDQIIVFAMDGLPEALLPGLRRFLDGGGRAVWTGLPPGLEQRDPETGEVTALVRARASELLGVDLSAWHADVYPARPTPAGRRRGLAGAWLSSPSAAEAADGDAEGLTILARDTLGRPAAWSKTYAGGGSFVYLAPRPGSVAACQVALVAEYGLTNAGVSPEAAACGIHR